MEVTKGGIIVLKNYGQTEMELSPYQGLYDAIIPKEHILRRLKENIDFSFVNPMLKKQYCEHFGRPAKEPEMIFKLLFLKKLYDLSDERVISSSQTDMAYKYFLGLAPEDKMIDPSLLTKFRKTRITEDILEELLKETIQQAISKGLVKSGTIIVDATHVEAAVNAKSHTQVLRELSKQFRKEIYKHEYNLSEKFPDKPSIEAELSEEIDYTRQLLESVREGVEQSSNKEIRDLYNRIKELLDSEKIYKIRSKDDEDARFGHKTPTKKFFGYKTHIAMSDDRIITGIEVTDGAQNDGKQLPKLIEKSKKNGVDVKEVVGDMAYVSDDNLEACEKEEVVLYAKTNCAVAAAAKVNLDEGFVYNKDAHMLQCPAGHLAMRERKRIGEAGNTHYTYAFSKKKCRGCPLWDTCPVHKGTEYTYSYTEPNQDHRARLEFENSEEFNKKLEVRHRIEEKNGEMKTAHGFQRADSVGMVAMRLQAYLTAIVVNMKRIVAAISV
jgi:transposase